MSDSVDNSAALRLAERALAGIETSVREIQEFLSFVKQEMERPDHSLSNVEMWHIGGRLDQLELAFEQNIGLMDAARNAIVQGVPFRSTEAVNQTLEQTVQQLRAMHAELGTLYTYWNHIILENQHYLGEGGGVAIVFPRGAYCPIP